MSTNAFIMGVIVIVAVLIGILVLDARRSVSPMPASTTLDRESAAQETPEGAPEAIDTEQSVAEAPKDTELEAATTTSTMPESTANAPTPEAASSQLSEEDLFLTKEVRNNYFSISYPDVFTYVKEDNFAIAGVGLSNTPSDSEWSVGVYDKNNTSLQKQIDGVWKQFPDREVSVRLIRINDLEATHVRGTVASRPGLMAELVLIDGTQRGQEDLLFVISNGASQREGFEAFYRSIAIVRK